MDRDVEHVGREKKMAFLTGKLDVAVLVHTHKHLSETQRTVSL